jgi:hypothetical protein
MAEFEKLLKTVFYQDAPQCSACNRAAVQGVVKRRNRPKGRSKRDWPVNPAPGRNCPRCGAVEVLPR